MGEGVEVEEVAGAVDDTDVGGRTKLLVDAAILDNEFIEMETLDIPVLLDDATEL